MHTHNTTFVCSEIDLAPLLGYIRSKTIPLLLEGGHAGTPRLARVCSAIPGQDGTESISLQFEFDNKEAYAGWKRTLLPRALGELQNEFGDKVLTFTTLLQHLPHE